MKKWAVITGASSGIGKELCHQLAPDYNIVLVARRVELLEQLKKELEQKFGNTCEVLPLDLSHPQSAQTCFEFATKDKRQIELLINNAGVGHFSHFLDEDLSKFQKIVQLNLSTVIDLCHFFGNHMKDHGRKSHIVNIASVASNVAIPKYSIYCATKEALKTFSQIFQYEYRKSHIKVSCAFPGGTDTDFMKNSADQVISKTGQWSLMSPERLAKGIISGFKRDKSLITVGVLNKFLNFMAFILPRKLMMPMSGKMISSSLSNKN